MMRNLKKSYAVTNLQGKNVISPPPPLMNLPPPSGKSILVEYHQLIVEKSQLHVEDSLKRARDEQDSFMEQFLYLK